ncbi:MAG TPA: DUF6790 family protein [Puia sp.]|nr:DUF6790 family protein [Puia sp.]
MNLALNKKYIIAVSVFTVILPVICTMAETSFFKEKLFSFALFGKWFIVSAVGLRLFTAGVKQTTDPAFTAREIFNISDVESLTVIRELGFANVCFGLTGIISLFMPEWRIVSAFGSGLYYGIAGFQHLFKKRAGANQTFAMITDILIFIFLSLYFVKMI